MRKLVLDGKVIQDNSECYVIAEIGHNHQGQLDTAKEMFKVAKECGADAVKLQKRDNRSLFTKEGYDKPYDNPNSYGATYGEHREFLEFSYIEYKELKDYADEIGVTMFSTAFDFASADFLQELDIKTIPRNAVICSNWRLETPMKYAQYIRDPEGSDEAKTMLENGSVVPFAEVLCKCDIIVNCVLQDTDNPITYIRNKDVGLLKPGTLIVDVSCDTAMGFEFARPTTFDEPMLTFGNEISYYAVDHSPSLLYDTASFEHSKTAWPHVKDVLDGETGWSRNPTVGKAVEFLDGVVVNPKILTFQNREKDYPHRKL